ncbi:MAG: hypothetical protein F6K54_14300 [Okeania sp. SIO3B5]|uniref:hypothetical protein n=1 Tax=Okeania sp. SIO3B5 TaxID=2607811 RepID=UPI001400C965|nr:hypothetical protein [Okeania sp. SIO3B5]NEO54146.1 hypothetical protein [Okeania sp. SIO3B5]
MSDRVAERMFYRYFIKIHLKSNNYNVGVCWYFWKEAIALYRKIAVESLLF